MAQLDRAIAHGEFDLGYFVVSPTVREADLLKVCPDAERFVLNGPHRSFRLPVATIAQREFVPVIFFASGKISTFRLFHHRSGTSTWADWSEVNERSEQNKNASWIASNLGVRSPHSFPWGLIDSVFDQKSGSSSIVVTYR